MMRATGAFLDRDTVTLTAAVLPTMQRLVSSDDEQVEPAASTTVDKESCSLRVEELAQSLQCMP